MRLLFLDTETSGVNFLEDQIIELAGIVLQFDPVSLSFSEISRFESLVGLRQQLDEKITRITGITDLDLANAPKLQIAQQQWADWLEALGKIDAVIGHSIDFDLRFLKKESWFLPEGYKIIDTLDLSKIFFPNLSAVNLEFLKEKLDLVASANSSGIKDLSHRALFDTYVCFLLFQNIINKIKNTSLPANFLKLLELHFLPLSLNFYPRALDLSNSVSRSIKTKIDKTYIDLNGNIVETGLYNRINNADPLQVLNTVLEILKTDLPRDFILVLLQMYIIYDIKLKNPEYSLKLHTQGNMGVSLAETVLDLVEKNSQTQIDSDQSKIVLSPFEGIIVQIRFIAESYYDIAKIVKNLELYLTLKLHLQRLDQSTVTVEKWLSSYDFLLISLSPFWRNNEFKYFQYLLNHQTKQIVSKYTSFCELTRELSKNKLDNSNLLFQALGDKISKLLANLDIYELNDSTFRLFNNHLTISKSKPGFDLEKHFEKLLVTYRNLEIETYLSETAFSEFVLLLGLGELLEKNNLNITYLIEQGQDYINGETLIEQVDLKDFLSEKLELAKNAKKPVIVLGGQNSTLKDAQKILIENFEVSQYLALGESGSLTKVGSKIERGFVGVVVTKVGDINFLLKQRNVIDFEQIWIVNQPYLWIHPFWLKRYVNNDEQEEFLLLLKKVYLEFQINQISILSKKPVNFLKSYKL
jgi:DNA polymerase III epsilon subunit-like protein